MNPILNAMACALFCASLAACDVNPEMNSLPEPADQKAFQSEWKKGLSRYSYSPEALKKIPKEIRNWTGRVLVKNTVDHRIELFVVQIADKAAVAVYGVEPDLRADRADAGAYIEFSGTLPDTPKMRYFHDELRIAGIWELVEVKLDSVRVPGLERRRTGVF